MTYDDLTNKFFLIAGPCVIESLKHCLFMAKELKQMAEDAGMPFVFKASFDKANRTSMNSYRGPGLEEGLNILAEVKATVGVPVTSDVHEVVQAAFAANVLDIIQIPAFLCRQTDLLVMAAKTGRIISVKKGQFLAPWDMANVVHKLEQAGNTKIILMERGATFGYNNLVVDFRSFPIMRGHGYPVCFDVTHSLQLPGNGGYRSGGQSEFIPTMARAGTAAGVDGLFMEVHDHPSEALSDGPNSARLNDMPNLLASLIKIRKAICE